MTNRSTGILPPEVATERRGDNPAATASEAAKRREALKEKDKLRKREERARDKQQAEVHDAMSKAETLQDFWAESLKTADLPKIAAWRERQERVLDTLHFLDENLNGTYDVSQDDTECYVSIEEGDEDLRQDIAEHGICAVTVIGLLGKFWQQPELLEKLTKPGDATSIAALYGIITAVPDIRVHQWDAFVAKHRSKNAPLYTPAASYISLRCARCGAPPTSVPVELAAAYQASREYLCMNCLQKAAKIREFARDSRSPEHAIFDSFGRVKDQ
jgi:hypothetical protein